MSTLVINRMNYQRHFEGKALLLTVGGESTRNRFAECHTYGNVSERAVPVSSFSRYFYRINYYDTVMLSLCYELSK